MKRKPIIAANWKMNKTLEEAKSFMQDIKGKVHKAPEVEAIVASPALFLETLVEQAKGTEIKIAAQNCYFEDEGAFTGEISPKALADLGVDYVIIGHSERREYFQETNEDINKKAHAIYRHGMLPIICCGESLEQYEAGETTEFVASQIKAALQGLEEEQIEQAVVAYEPIWAIGTGKTASAAEANETIKGIRDAIANMTSQAVAEKVRIQYGGSVKPDNIHVFMEESDIDGALVGGASLEADSFLALLEGAN